MTAPMDFSKFRKGITKSIPGISSGFNDPDTWISTGSHALNYLISSDFNKGIPLSKVCCFAGESGSGKSFLVSGNIIKNAQAQGIFCVLIDTENALDSDWLEALGVDTSEEKLQKYGVCLIDDVAKLISDFMTEYRDNFGKLPREERPKVLFVCDSLGMLLTPTDVKQFEGGDMKGDMGRKAKQLNALVKNIIHLIADHNVGFVATNHTYESQDMFNPDDKIAGGCLVAGTQLITSDGIKNIEDMQVGDRVMSNDGELHNVINTWKYDKPTFSLELEDGQRFECSPEHKFAVTRGDSWEWVKAEDLTEGDALLSMESEDFKP